MEQIIIQDIFDWIYFWIECMRNNNRVVSNFLFPQYHYKTFITNNNQDTNILVSIVLEKYLPIVKKYMKQNYQYCRYLEIYYRHTNERTKIKIYL